MFFFFCFFFVLLVSAPAAPPPEPPKDPAPAEGSQPAPNEEEVKQEELLCFKVKRQSRIGRLIQYRFPASIDPFTSESHLLPLTLLTSTFNKVAVLEINVLPIYAWVHSLYSGFLPLTKDMHVRVINESK